MLKLPRRSLVPIAGLLALATAAGVWLSLVEHSAAQEKKAPNLKERASLAKFMHAKLASAQSILEGLAIEDYEKIAAGATKLIAVSAAEEWQVSNDPVYSQQSEQFRSVAKLLKKQAQDKNLDGAALGYVQLALSCVECHKFVRNVLIADGK